MIRTEDLTEEDKINLFKNREIESEKWHYIEIDGILKDRYLFSSIGRCYDYKHKRFKKHYNTRNNNDCYWYLIDKYGKTGYLKVLVSDVLKKIFGFSEEVDNTQSIEDSIEAYSARVNLNDRIIKNYKDKIEKLKKEIDLLNDLISQELHNKFSSTSIMNAIINASNNPIDINEEIKITNYIGVKKYFDNINIKLKHSDYIQIGKLATRLCKDKEIEIRKNEDGVNRYPTEVLEMVWWEYQKRFD